MTTLKQNCAATGLNVYEAAKLAGVGRSTIYEELASGRLSARKLGRRTIIPEHALREWMENLPAYRSGNSSHNSPPG
jgi:excisionase family DNA binding protein